MPFLKVLICANKCQGNPYNWILKGGGGGGGRSSLKPTSFSGLFGRSKKFSNARQIRMEVILNLLCPVRVIYFVSVFHFIIFEVSLGLRLLFGNHSFRGGYTNATNGKSTINVQPVLIHGWRVV